MEPSDNHLPESLGYLPAFFRAHVESAGVPEHDFVRWLLEVFETNLHLAERITENSRMLLDPDEVAALPWKVGSPMFSVRDVADWQAFAARLYQHADAVSMFLWEGFSPATRQALADWEQSESDSARRQQAVIDDLNRTILRGPIYSAARFRGVRFSERTRAFQKLAPQREALVRLNRLLLEDAYPLELSALPEASLLQVGEWELTYLHWLASWVALDLDQEWFAEIVDEELPDPQPGSLSAAGRRYNKACDVIKQAARLYRERGTPRGLEKMIKLFYDWDVEILERSWPQGMDIGVASRVGVTSRLVDEPAFDCQCVALIRATAANSSRLTASGDRIEGELAGRARGRRVQWLRRTETQAADPSRERVVASVDRLRRLIDQEIPAHVHCYLAFETSPARPAGQPLPPMRIELDSKIEGFWIN